MYYNCDDVDTAGVLYGKEDYDYANSCEVWRIIGVFDTKLSEGVTPVKRVKLVNTASTFSAAWDSSVESINNGSGISQWGIIGDYEGADLMRLLNGYYIGKQDSTCTYCDAWKQETCEQICDTEENTLRNHNMKKLTNSAKSMIKNALWDTYAVATEPNLYEKDSAYAYLQEKGISAQYTGKSFCGDYQGYCLTPDSFGRDLYWEGLIGLPYASDMLYSSGWLYNNDDYVWTITPMASGINTSTVMYSYSSESVYYSSTGSPSIVWPSVYLKEGVKVIGGNGNDKPYILSVQ